MTVRGSRARVCSTIRPENSSGRCSNYVSKQFWSYLAELHAIAEPRVVAIPLPGVPGVTHVRGVVVLLEFGVHLDDPGHPFRHVGRNDCHRERTMCMWRMCHRCQAAAPRRLLDRSSVVECPACRPRQSIPLPQVCPYSGDSGLQSSMDLVRACCFNAMGYLFALLQATSSTETAVGSGTTSTGDRHLNRADNHRKRRRLGRPTIKFDRTNSVTHAGLNQSTQLGDIPMSVG